MNNEGRMYSSNLVNIKQPRSSAVPYRTIIIVFEQEKMNLNTQQTDIDVINGRRGGTNNHPGNVWFRNQIAGSKREYSSSTDEQKQAIVDSIVTAVTNRGGCFLKWDGFLKIRINN